MTEWSSQVDIAWQDELWIGRSSGDSAYSWTQIGGIGSLPFPEKNPESVDVTHMQSPGRSRETRPGLMTVAEARLEKQYWPLHAGDVLIEELATLSEAGAAEDVLVEFKIDGGARRTYRGHVTRYTPSTTVGEKRMATLALALFDRQPTNIRVEP